MHLTLGGASANGAPRDEVRDVLRRDHVEELATRRQPETIDVEQQAARQAKSLVDAEAAIEVRVVDETLPADSGARFLEVNPHHDLERALEIVALIREPARVLHRSLRVVDGAGPD